MKTVKQNNITFKTLDKIEIGEVFEYEGEIFMAIDDTRLLYDEESVNVINLVTAELKYLPYDVQVIPLADAKLVY